MGQGLFTTEDIQEGEFVIEYVGEVISGAAAKARFAQDGSSQMSYVMQLPGGYVLDSSRKGNLSKFLNHSCEPNCETQNWTIGWEVRVGIFAKTDIPKGAELLFDYQFEHFGGRPFFGLGLLVVALFQLVEVAAEHVDYVRHILCSTVR